MNCPQCGSEDIELDLSFSGAWYVVGIEDLGRPGAILTLDWQDAPSVDELRCNACDWEPDKNQVEVSFQ